MERYNDNYSGHCLTCANYELTTNWHDIHSEVGFRCKRHGWQDPYDKCSSYSKAHRSDGFIDDCMKEFDKKRRYYIVTTIVQLLGLGNDNVYLTSFENVCNKYLATNEGERLLLEYDDFGKNVSDKLYENYTNPSTNAETQEIIKTNILTQLDKMLDDLNNKNPRRAILRYVLLIRKLMQKYQINYDIKEESKTSIYDITKKLVKQI